MSPRIILLLGIMLGVYALFAASVLPAQPAPTSPEGLVRLGDGYLQNHDVSGARVAYERARAAEPDYAPALIGLARTELARGKWDAAAGLLDEVLARDENNPDARYYRAVTHREVAKFYGLLDSPSWGHAERGFQRLIEQDSTYRDVFYQYALLRQNAGAYPEALALAHTQLRLNPDQLHVRNGLLKLYRGFLHETRSADAQAWLAEHPSPYAAFFAAERLREAGRWNEADSVYNTLLNRGEPHPIPVLLARARLQYARDRSEQAQLAVFQAIDRIGSKADADLVFEDFKIVFSPDELVRYHSLSDPAQLKAFFYTFWAKRNPTPAGEFNARLAEHYRRLQKAEKEYAYFGLRSRQNSPDRLGELDVPDVYALNDALDDRGFVYVRHGDPDDRVATVSGDASTFVTSVSGSTVTNFLPREQSFDAPWVPNESWRYFDPRMDFHFVVDGGAGVENWRVTPALTNLEMLEDREHWGGVYARLASAARELKELRDSEGRAGQTQRYVVVVPQESQSEENPDGESEEANTPRVVTVRPRPNDLAARTSRASMELTNFRDELVRLSREAVSLGFSTDHHTWAEDVKPLEMPYVVSAFRGKEGNTRLEIHYALPLGRLTSRMGGSVHTVNVEVGCALFETSWRPVDRETEVKVMPPSPDMDTAALDYCDLTAPPDSYHVALHGKPTGLSELAGFNFGYRVPDFSGGALLMSDLLPATEIRPASGASRFDRGEFHLSVNPFTRFSTRHPVFVYFEIYNLTFDADDRTHYEVAYTLTPTEPRRGFLGRARNDRPVLSLASDHAGTEAAPREAAEIDVSRVDPGRYVLTVRVTNNLTGDAVERALPLDLTP